MTFTMGETTASPIAGRQKRERQKNVRRDAILAAARKVFAREGYEGATIADIAKEAGVASGTVYLYYASKTDLFAALNAVFFQAIQKAMIQTDAPPDVEGGTRARIRAVFEACAEHRDLVRLVFLNPDPRTEVARRMKNADEARLQPLADLLQGGMEAGVVRQADARFLARLVTGLVTIALYQCFVQSEQSDVGAFESTVSDMVIGALTPN
jgi:AcrR family transcriptional regulator